jgi:hypothetical protein
MTGTPDDELVKAIKSDPEAVTRLVNAFLDKARYIVISRLSKSVRASADPSQIALNVLGSVVSDFKHNRVKVETMDEFERQIVRKSIRRAISAARQETAARRDVARRDGSADISLAASAAGSPAAEAEANELAERAVEIVDREPDPPRREAMWLVLFDKYTYEEAANQVNQIAVQSGGAAKLTAHIVEHCVRAVRIIIKRELGLEETDD